MARGKITVEISNITEDQAQAFRRLFAWMNSLGERGSTRRGILFYDGDGGARARIKVNSGLEDYWSGDIDDARFDFE